MPAKEKELQKATKVDDYVTVDSIDDFKQTERLSKRLARMGVCSRRQAEIMIERRMIKVDGIVVDSNVAVNNLNLI